MEARRIYRHFCMLARALEIVGERWSLLIVRDLLLGPRRFTDLRRSLGEITPARLTGRLRQLEAGGIVTRERPSGGREVWYALTPAGRDLEPVIDALTLWGIDHAFEPPRLDEPVAAAPTMIGTNVIIRRRAGTPHAPVTWVWRFDDDDSYTVRGDQAGWTLSRGRAETADVVVETTLATWARFLTARGRRKLPYKNIELTGTPDAVAAFARVFESRR